MTFSCIKAVQAGKWYAAALFLLHLKGVSLYSGDLRAGADDPAELDFIGVLHVYY